MFTPLRFRASLAFRRFALLLAAGSLSTAALAQTATPVYKHWPMRANNQDSAAVRSANVTGGATTFRKFVVGDGSVIPAYSTLYGQSFGVNAAGGNWSTSAGGTGGIIRRGFYEQFTVTTTAGATGRADSVIVTAGFYASQSGTLLAAAYSLSNFAADSAEVTGGRGPGGVFASPTTGGPTNPIALTQVAVNTPNSSIYRLALNGATGVTLTAGQTLTVRLYVSCSSSSAGRYALLKNVIIKGRQTLATKAAVSRQPLTAYPNPFGQAITVAHEAAPQAATVQVYSLTGQHLSTTAVRPGTRSTTLELPNLPAGLYQVEYRTATERHVAKLAKQ